MQIAIFIFSFFFPALSKNSTKKRPESFGFTGFPALKAEASDGNRTRLPSLGSSCSTDELRLHNKVTLTQFCLLRKSHRRQIFAFQKETANAMSETEGSFLEEVHLDRKLRDTTHPVFR